MAFKSMAKAKEEFEAAVAAARPYRVADAGQAKALFLYLRTSEASREKMAREESTRRHVAANPDDREARAGLAVFEASDPLTWNVPLFLDRAVRAAERILDAPEDAATFYHATTPDALGAILETGLKPSGPRGVTPGVLLFRDRGDARRWGSLLLDVPEADVALVEADITGFAADDLRSEDPDDTIPEHGVLCIREIPADRLSAVPDAPAPRTP